MDFFAEDTASANSIGPFHSSTSNSVNPGRKGSHGFLQKLFSRQPSIPKNVTAGLEGQVIPCPFGNTADSNHIDPEVVPCPYIRPLGNRLEPRVESTPLAPRRLLTDAAMSISRKKGEVSLAAHSCLSLGNADKEPRRKLSASDIMNLRSLRLREDIAVAATADPCHLKEWGCYIKCYSEGRYSLTAPPGPPPKNLNFTYLPSTYPPNELERLATFQSSHIWSGTEIVWSGLEAERARTLIMAATNKFATPWGAISFFDRDTEIVQAERGYSRHLIPRRDSIASHVLLTDEVMTVLDARKVNSLSNYLKSTAEIKQDWRFVGNPLVTGNPKICFFAGAPLLSANSQVIGVFAIFGPEPRASFTAMQRRDLTGLSELATRDLTARRDVSSSIILQSSLTLQPGSCDGTTNSSRPTSSPPPSLEMESHRVHSVALRYHKALQNSVPRSRIIINSERRDACFQNVDYTPPNSDDSDEGPSPVLANFKGFGKNYKQLSLAALPNPPPSDIRTPDSPTFGDCPPNLGALQPGSFSVSDLTPLDRDQHPCIPGSHYTNDIGRSFGESRRCNNNFSSDDAVVFLTPHPNRPMEQISDTSSLSINSKAREALLDEALLLSERLDATFVDGAEQVLASASKAGEPGTGSINYEPTDYQDNLDIESAITSDLTSEEVHGSVDVQAEARFAAELWAKNLEFDAIYAVELIPRRKVMKLSELKAPGNVDTCILVAYGLPDPINFDIPIHLDVLRGSGAITWENKNAMPKEYSRGFMMPLLFENGMLDYLSSGVVFGAFRRRPDGIKESPNLRSAEVERLQQAANVLKGILSKSSALRRQSYGEVGPLPSTSPQPYPANEAIEVSQVSLDAGMATCARRKKPKNLMRWQLGGSD